MGICTKILCGRQTGHLGIRSDSAPEKPAKSAIWSLKRALRLNLRKCGELRMKKVGKKRVYSHEQVSPLTGSEAPRYGGGLSGLFLLILPFKF